MMKENNKHHPLTEESTGLEGLEFNSQLEAWSWASHVISQDGGTPFKGNRGWPGQSLRTRQFCDGCIITQHVGRASSYRKEDRNKPFQCLKDLSFTKHHREIILFLFSK